MAVVFVCACVGVEDKAVGDERDGDVGLNVFLIPPASAAKIPAGDVNARASVIGLEAKLGKLNPKDVCEESPDIWKMLH